MSRFLDEKTVRRAAIAWLSRKGYHSHLKEKETAEHGIDIKVRHHRYNRWFLVEAKGDPDPKKSKYPDSQRETYFLSILGQIITRMSPSSLYWYGIALPYTFESRVVRRIPWEVCKKLRLKIFLVDSKEKVREITWKELKKLQSK